MPRIGLAKKDLEEHAAAKAASTSELGSLIIFSKMRQGSNSSMKSFCLFQLL